MKKYIKSNKVVTYEDIKSGILEDFEDGVVDPMDWQTFAGAKLLELCDEVDHSLGVGWVSEVQSGIGKIYFVNEDEEFVGLTGYEEFHDQIYDILISSDSEDKFKRNYKRLVESVIADSDLSEIPDSAYYI